MADRKTVCGFVPHEAGGGDPRFTVGQRVRVARGRQRDDFGRPIDYFPHKPSSPAGTGVVVDVYSRASDAWSPYSPAVSVQLDPQFGIDHAVEYFIGYDLIEPVEVPHGS